MFLKIHGFPNVALPIIIPSTLVFLKISKASSGDFISPFPITGIVTLSFTAFIISQSATPE